MADIFGCCSSYKVCSEQGKCIHLSNPGYSGCQYRKNLEAGRNFYSSNKSFKVVKISEKKQSRELYITCYRQLFQVFSKDNKHWYSRKLDTDTDTVTELSELFDKHKIPYRHKQDPIEELEGDILELSGPSNRRVIFEYSGNEYTVYNQGCYLMHDYIAESIKKAFANKGIKSRVEIIGSNYEKGEVVSRIKFEEQKQVSTVTKTEVKVTKIDVKVTEPSLTWNNKDKYTQVSIFDLLRVAGG